MTTTPQTTHNESRPRSSTKKVALDELIFTLSWEDPDLDRAAFAAISPGGRIATVASGGCNALTLLLDDPREVVAFDYNPTQVFVLELKRAAFMRLSHPELLELFGVRPSARREALLARLSTDLSTSARAFWSRQRWLVSSGLLGGGRYERFVRAFRTLLLGIQGKSTVTDLFLERDRDARVRFFDERWDGVAWRLLFRMFFNKRVLASRGLSADYFHFAAGSESFAEAFARRTKRVLTELPVRDNPFVAQYTLGRFLDEEHLPLYLRPESFDTLKERMPRLSVRVADVRNLADDYASGHFDGICLSNVFELMNEDETAKTMSRIAGLLVDGGRVTLRNLMIPRGGPAVAPGLLQLDEALSRSLHEGDRSFVYRSFYVYSRIARSGQ